MTRHRFYPFLVLVLCAFFLFYKYILQVYPGVMTMELMEEFHLDGTGLGNLAANYFYAYLVTQIFVGVLLDKYGARTLSAIAILAGGLGALLFAHTTSLGFAEFARILMGFGSAFATVCYLKNTATWFSRSKYFAFVSGLLATAAMMGAIFGVAPLAILVHHDGWRSTIKGVGFGGVVLSLAFWLLVRNKNPFQPETREEKFGLSLKAVWTVLRSKQNWLLTLYSGLSFTPIAVFGGLWGNPFLKTVHHLSETGAGSVISFSFLGLAVGAPLLGLCSDRMNNPKRVMLFGNILAFISISIVVYAPALSMSLLCLLLFSFGFGIGGFMLCFAVGTRSNSVMMAATVIAMINSGDSIFGSFTEPLLGKFLDLRWNGAIVNGAHVFTAPDYRLALSVLPVYLLISVFLLKWIRDH